MSQNDLFGDKIDASVLEHIQSQPADMHDCKRWPQLLLELESVLRERLKAESIEDEALALKLVLSIGDYMGGMQVYLPRGDALYRYVRDMEIYQSFNGRNTKQLAKAHHLSEKSIYQIIADMRKIEHARRQPGLF